MYQPILLISAAIARSEQEAQKSPRFQSEAITRASYAVASEGFSFPHIGIRKAWLVSSTVTDRERVARYIAIVIHYGYLDDLTVYFTAAVYNP